MSGEAWCVQEGDVWHAVLGDYHPDSETFLAPSDPACSRTVQRTCDQNLVTYERVEFMMPTCLGCQRAKALMVEFATKYEDEDDGHEDDPGLADGNAEQHAL